MFGYPRQGWLHKGYSNYFQKLLFEEMMISDTNTIGYYDDSWLTTIGYCEDSWPTTIDYCEDSYSLKTFLFKSALRRIYQSD